MGTYRSYAIGFVTSLLLTLSAFYLVGQYTTSHHEPYSPVLLVALVIGLALVQLTVQLIFFLHLGRQRKSRWNLIVFLFMLMVVVMVVGGSLWIMQNLNYHMQSDKAEKSIIQDEGIRHSY